MGFVTALTDCQTCVHTYTSAFRCFDLNIPTTMLSTALHENHRTSTQDRAHASSITKICSRMSKLASQLESTAKLGQVDAQPLSLICFFAIITLRCGPIDMALHLMVKHESLRSLVDNMTSHVVQISDGLTAMHLAATRGTMKVQVSFEPATDVTPSDQSTSSQRQHMI